MKNIRIKTLFLSLMTTVFAVGCAESDDYSTPDSVREGVEDVYLAAYITSSDAGGNFFKSISMETADGKGLSVSVDVYNTYTKGFEVGRKVLIKLNGLRYAITHNSLVLGVLYTNPATG